MKKPNVIQRMTSKAIQEYFIHSPIEKGKYWLRACTGSLFLIGQLENKLWIRISGVSGFEWSVFSKQQKEATTRQLIEKLVTPKMTFFDIGANIGYYSLITSILIEDGEVHAFEPTPELAERIRYNAKLNGLHNIKVNQAGVSDHDGEIELHICQDDSEGNSLVAFEADWPTVIVPVLKIDSYIKQNAIKYVNVIKLDCEGAEFSVLRGCQQLMQSEFPPVIIMEFNPETLISSPYTIEEIISYISDLNYKFYILEKLKSGDISVYNLLLIKDSHIEQYPVLKQHCNQPFIGLNL
jgi:FkbM family methyltransferase